jgi:iron-sulfur cluster assembly protein
MLKISDSAAKQILAEIERQGASSLALRIAAHIDEDRSIQYQLGFDEVGESETPILIADIKVLMDEGTEGLLDEAEMDFVELEPGQPQFIFKNPLDPGYVPPQD